MAHLGDVKLGNNLTFNAQTTKFDTGVATAADSLPTWRIYEEETATPLLTGTFATLDSANTTGFYSEQVACTSGNGFEAEKFYSIHKKATVNTVAGAAFDTFKVVANIESDTFGRLGAPAGASIAADLVVIDDFVDTLETSVATILTRVPAEVAQKQHLVNGTGDITPPTDKGIWDYLDKGLTSTSQEVIDLLDALIGGKKRDDATSPATIYFYRRGGYTVLKQYQGIQDGKTEELKPV